MWENMTKFDPEMIRREIEEVQAMNRYYDSLDELQPSNGSSTGGMNIFITFFYDLLNFLMGV